MELSCHSFAASEELPLCTCGGKVSPEKGADGFLTSITMAEREDWKQAREFERKAL